MPEVSVVIVCMNRPDNLRPCLEGISRHTRTSCEIYVVAYMFTAENLLWLKNGWPDVKVIESSELRGFSENNNLALRHVRGRYTFIVNDDTEMRMPVIDRLVEDFGRLGDKAAAISPKIIFPDGKVQTCGRGLWNARRWLRHYYRAVDETRPSEKTMQPGLFRTWTLNGACFMIRTDVFRQAGFFDETYTFTPEDIALGTLLSLSGKQVWADSDIEIVHKAGATASRMEAAIKPARVRGDLIFYSSFPKVQSPQGTDRIRPLKYAVLGIAVWTYEALRGLKYLFAPGDGSPKATPVQQRRARMRLTAKNVRRSIFTRLSPKEIFIKYYNELTKCQ